MGTIQMVLLKLDENAMKYVPWDPKVLEQGARGVVDNLGTGINVGLRIFLILVGASVVFSVIRGFAR